MIASASQTINRQAFETNTFGVMAVIRAVVPHMRERGSGTIVNVTSSVGVAPMPLVAIYTASKYAIEGFSESLAYELGTFGVRVKIVEPGLALSTSFGANSGGRRDDLMPAAYSDYAAATLNRCKTIPRPIPPKGTSPRQSTRPRPMIETGCATRPAPIA